MSKHKREIKQLEKQVKRYQNEIEALRKRGFEPSNLMLEAREYINKKIEVLKNKQK